MSKRYTPAKSALAKRAAFTSNRQQFRESRKQVPFRYHVRVHIAEANVHGMLLALWGHWDRADELLTRRAFGRL